MSLTVKKGDNVVVLAGKDKGATGKIIAVDPTDKRVRVENVNMVSRHRKARSAQDVGGITKMEGTLDISNVQVICPACNKATRIGATEVNGKKIRVCKKCGASLDVKVEKTKKTSKKDSVKKDSAKKETKTGEAKAKRTTKKKVETAETGAEN